MRPASYTTGMATKHWFEQTGGPPAHRRYEPDDDQRRRDEQPVEQEPAPVDSDDERQVG